MKFAIVLIAVWFSNQLEPVMVEVGSTMTACQIINAQQEMRTGINDKIISIKGYSVYPEISPSQTVVLKTESLLCPSGFDFDTLLDAANKEAIAKLAVKGCKESAAKKDWKNFFLCVSERIK